MYNDFKYIATNWISTVLNMWKIYKSYIIKIWCNWHIILYISTLLSAVCGTPFGMIIVHGEQVIPFRLNIKDKAKRNICIVVVAGQNSITIKNVVYCGHIE